MAEERDDELHRTLQFEPITSMFEPAAEALAGGALNATQAVELAEATGEFALVAPPPRRPDPSDHTPTQVIVTSPPTARPATITAEQPGPVAEHLSDDSAAKVRTSTLLMAAGTIFSRLSGYFRGMLLIAALGAGVHADIFNLANTVPNMVYILVAGGVFNAVLVPQLVRAMKNDADGGDAYANRLITLAGLFLGGVTVALVIFAPALMDLVLGSKWGEPGMAAQRQSAIDFARFCLPQVFFYGMFVLVGQILNARGSFGPMMWAPIANNVLSVLVLVAYLVGNGSVAARDASAYTGGQEAFLGIGATLGIVVQFFVLLPYLRRAGFRFTPRFDFRGTGLGHTLHLGIWTVLFVIVNQAAYLVVTKLASDGSADDGTGLTVYSNVFLVMMVPHSVITVSLATALLPRLSALAEAQRLPDLGTTLGGGLRQALAIILPFTALLPLVAGDLAKVAWGASGALEDGTDMFVPTLICFAPAMLFFTVHYLMLRGFYAQELNRLVFFIQVAVSATNIVMALLLVNSGPPEETAPRLALAYGCAYAVGAVVTFLAMRSRVGSIDGSALASFLWRMVLALAAAAVVTLGVEHLLGGWGHSWRASLLRGGFAGGLGMVTFVLMCAGLQIREVTDLVGSALRPLTRRVRGKLGLDRSRAGDASRRRD